MTSGTAMNIRDSAVGLAADAAGYLADPTEANHQDLVMSLRIMQRRIQRALDEIGGEP